MTEPAIGTGRAVEVLHDRGPAPPAGGDRWTSGSGYLIGSGLVLTAAHNVDYRRDLGGDEQLLVRTIDGDLLAARVVLACDEPSRVDLALLEISDPRFGQHLPPVTFARVNRDSPAPVTGCWAVGFPRFGEAGPVLPGGSRRETWQVSGHILPGGKRRAGLLSLQVTSNPSASLTGSAWEGMSGAVVFAADAHNDEQAAVGVISTHHRPEGESALTVVPITAVAELAAAAKWWQQFGVPGRDTLPILPRQRARAVLVRPTSAAGRPLEEVTDPFVLEVHRPVQPEDAPAGLPLLPPYVPREHDQLLAQVVAAAAEGRSGIAVLVGGSSTGKTRACWEALALLRDQDPPWRLWHPIDPSRPDAARRELASIAPRTVVWLNEAQFYLDTAEGGLGERVAAGLRELLRNPARAPALVLATVWPGFWDTLTARPADSEDRHAQARELLAGHDITVPAAFTPVQMGQLTRAPDARMALAARSAPDGAVIQFLAGAPELLARYRNAPPAAAALIRAAMDARRLGMGAGLPQAFLEAAASGYLTDAQWDVLGEDWLERALVYTAVPCKGVRGPLTRIRPRPARPAARRGDQPASMAAATGTLYRLADYLDQHSRAHRASQIPPTEFWSAATAHAAPGDQAAVLRAALEAYGKTREPEFLDHAIGLADDLARDEILGQLDRDGAAIILSLGGAARIHRSRLSDHPHDLDDAVLWCRRALEASDDGDANRPPYASNLALVLVERYDRDGRRADLDEALALFEWAVPAIRIAGRPASVALHNQGQALLDLYQADHDVAALNRAIGVLREASADTTQPREVIGGYLNTLGQALRAKAEAAADPSALHEAVQILRRALGWTIGSDDQVAALVSLGNALLDRSEMTEPPVQDLEESASYLEQALSLVTPGTSRWGHLASNLGNALVALFRATGRRAVLEQARGLFEQAGETLAGSPDREVCLSNLAACLQELHEQTGEITYLDEAIEVFRGIVDESADSAVPERRQNYGVALLTRFKRYQSPADLDQAIDQFRVAARTSPPGSVIRAAAANSLGNALFLRFDLLGQNDDMVAAISAHKEAVRNARENSIDRDVPGEPWASA